jgi:hypothetical protein
MVFGCFLNFSTLFNTDRNRVATKPLIGIRMSKTETPASVAIPSSCLIRYMAIINWNGAQKVNNEKKNPTINVYSNQFSKLSHSIK